jgi:hypothetical protein
MKGAIMKYSKEQELISKQFGRSALIAFADGQVDEAYIPVESAESPKQEAVQLDDSTQAIEWRRKVNGDIDAVISMLATVNGKLGANPLDFRVPPEAKAKVSEVMDILFKAKK